MSTIAYIGLGSNLGDSRQILTQAVSRLSTLGPVKVSRLYQSPPMGPQDQPHYYNAVAQLETVLEPLPLLDQLQAFEQEAGRVRLRRWGERTLDLDLLLYGQQSIQHERLNVPHIGLLERDFVVIPLLDLNVSLSVNGQLLQQLDLVQQSELTVLADEQWASI
ncbi:MULTISPECIES: 2-amino-4-hydroxy-6-hydroxymethyldihydropteridine diphosphokinase [Acinetobacter]|jgi:2-amino-4-hydroxy-6-hydroxymethyldihydropteridine diphosphokinase|uniref:2-amino-4-hydroxy-6-hydroxymethyldihydropteridine pyrophosphokinase n=1 Tax=Acinetobacter radioresistens TaxID=40216 RepID=A0A8H2K127_ACIRA|nr:MULTISPECIES: 2-amino-4-hydroxy-6-hydroxymethyldihydropteridine diphosphokinase [Acinetobacter]ENV91066.1 2-amino-4-hydroxy-6-hydroxymethyldihydropteridine diphosphokinase [Acinetobacter radioresistens DSM 6976 = NBRC 102413 = CIP 103788]EXB34620.1 2-amino-4-hydroxy-6-hydroxymethyldihydropteridine diphosphokinase [Acinetobacter sp. 1461402]EXB73218.1 2-amino-4-hydroxy-6-hydroxymethyldihydropteridine diphosphokinase [Acinetobacter sp. 230853]EXC33574.1 2-amino-4-hydroxy-6-hydroxymethyldihydro